MSDLIKFSEILEYQGLEISAEDLFKLQIIQWQNSQKQRRLAFRLNVYQSPVTNGRTFLIIGLAVLGFGVALALGAGLAMAIAIGAAIGYSVWKRGQQKSRNQNQQRVVNAAGFDSVPSPPQIGGVIPLVYCNTAINPAGGLRLNSSVLFSRVVTTSNKQELLLLRSVGLGSIQSLDSSKILIDNQPASNFLQSEVYTEYSTGTADQPRFADVPYYCQAASVNTQNTLGYSLRGTFTSTSGNVANTSVDDFDSFTPSEIYEHTGSGQEFRVVNKNASANQIFLNSNLSLPNDSKIYAKYTTKFKTLKRCSELEVNLVLNIWARNNDSNLIKFAACWQVKINDIAICYLYEINSKEGDIRRAFTLRNLILKQHKLELTPRNSSPNDLPKYRIDDSGVFREINTNITVDGKQVILRIESKPENQVSDGTLNDALNQENKPQKSSDRGAYIKVSSFNQIVYASDINQSGITNYPSLKLAYNRLQASERLTGSPALSDWCDQGVPFRNHVAAGQASPNSAGNLLIANGADLSGLAIGHTLRNITRQIESVITSIVGANIVTQSNLNWKEGDVFLGYFTAAITYFPDVFCHTLLAQENLGWANNEKYIDYVGIVKARKFCVDNNYFYNDAIDVVTNWDEWVSRECSASLLFPTDYCGTAGLLPEQYTEPTAVFTASNIKPGSFRQSPPEQKDVNCLQLTYNYREDDNLFKKTIACFTQNAYLGVDKLKLEAVEYESICRASQARDVAARYMKSRLIQNEIIQFQTGLQGFSLEAGDLIIVQYALTEKEAEFSGFCLGAGNLSGGQQTVELSRSEIIESGMSATVYHLQSGLVEKNKPILRLNDGQFNIGGLVEAIQPKSLTRNGDIVIVNGDVTKKIYRVTGIKPDNYGVSVYAIIWSQDLLTEDGLVFVE
jgi:nuclear transport factor 2 (NTF2) superfamily protein